MALATGLPLLLAFVTGSISIPHNDAWSHSKIAEEFGRTGSFRLLGWNRTALVGQVLPLGPLAMSIVAQHLFVAALSLVALSATYAYLGSRVVPSAALLGTVLVGINPEFGLLATSFMSDIPAFAALMVCLVLTDRARLTQQTGYLALALVVGVWGVTIREQGLVGPAVAVAVTSLAWRGPKRLIALALGVVAAAAIGAFELWRRSLPYGDPPVFALDLSKGGHTLILAVFTVGLYVAPAVISVARPTEWSVRTRWFSAIALLVALATAAYHYPGVFLGNYLGRFGAYAAAGVGTTAEVVPPWLWMALVGLACVSLALATGLLLDGRCRMDRTSGLLATLLVVGTVAQAAAGQTVFARYLLPLLPVACVALLSGRAPRHPRAVIPTLAFLAVVSMGITAHALSFDAARWQAASGLHQRGTPATDINAGLEWVGYHATEPAVRGPTRRGASWYMRMFPRSRECFLVSASPLRGLRLVDTYEYRSYSPLGPSQLRVYQRLKCL